MTMLEDSFERSLNLFQTIGKEDDPVVVGTTLPYAMMLMDMADYEAARPLLERGLSLYEDQVRSEQLRRERPRLCARSLLPRRLSATMKRVGSSNARSRFRNVRSVQTISR